MGANANEPSGVVGRDLLGYKCNKCGTVHYPYRMVCRKCGHVLQDLLEKDPYEIVPLPRKGRLLTFTVLHTLPGDFEMPEMSLGVVELENGVRVTGRLDIDAPKIGMKVAARVDEVRREAYAASHGFVFTKG